MFFIFLFDQVVSMKIILSFVDAYLHIHMFTHRLLRHIYTHALTPTSSMQVHTSTHLHKLNVDSYPDIHTFAHKQIIDIYLHTHIHTHKFLAQIN